MTNADRADRASSIRGAVVAAIVVTTAMTIVLLLVALTVPAWAERALHWYLVGVGAVMSIAALRALVTRYPVLWRSSFDATLPDASDEIPARLRAIMSLVSRSRWDVAGFRLELRPLLRTIAAQRLTAYRSLDLARDSEAARAVLGERAWMVLHSRANEAADEHPDLDPQDLRLVVEALETLDADAHD